MGISAALNNALTGLQTSQRSIEIVSRNVSNAGTPGYHRQSLDILDGRGAFSTYARSAGLTRAFTESLHVAHSSATTHESFANTRVRTLDRLQALFGKPGDLGALGTQFGQLNQALQALSTSPDNFGTRATVVSQAQELATSLNTLTRDIQELRRDSEIEIASSVNRLNINIQALYDVNARLADYSAGPDARAAFADQRDRLIADIAQEIDINVDYNANDTVSIATSNGVKLVDIKTAQFNFTPTGALTPSKLFDPDPSKNRVGVLTLTSASGSSFDLVASHTLGSGRLAALVELRDKDLVAAQAQIDQVAAGVAQAFSTVTTEGSAASSGTNNGLALDLAAIRDGNDFTLQTTKAGIRSTLRVVRVDDASKLPLDYIDANGTRVIGADFAAGASTLAAQVSSVLGSGFTATGSGTTLTVLDDGATNNTDVTGLTGHRTSTAPQDGTLAVNLFVERDGSEFTDSLSGEPKKRGFAGRIAVNPIFFVDNTLLVKNLPTVSSGSSERPNYLLDQLNTLPFASPRDDGGARIGGPVIELISQTQNNVGFAAELAQADLDVQQISIETLNQRLDDEYGVSLDVELSRLTELQNAYAANGRVISVVRDLLDRLLSI